MKKIVIVMGCILVLVAVGLVGLREKEEYSEGPAAFSNTDLRALKDVTEIMMETALVFHESYRTETILLLGERIHHIELLMDYNEEGDGSSQEAQALTKMIRENMAKEENLTARHMEMMQERVQSLNDARKEQKKRIQDLEDQLYGRKEFQ